MKSAPLHGVAVGPDLIPQTIDEFPILCVAAAVAEGETTITGAEELRVKESDRIATMAAELRAMGAQMTETPDGMVIQGLGRHQEHGRLTPHKRTEPWRPSRGDVDCHRGLDGIERDDGA